MTYIKVAWIHNFDDEPIEMLSELDDKRMETRKVERFRDGALRFAGPDAWTGETRLGDTPIPALDEIAEDPQFRPLAIDRDDFELEWQAARLVATSWPHRRSA